MLFAYCAGHQTQLVYFTHSGLIIQIYTLQCIMQYIYAHVNIIYMMITEGIKAQSTQHSTEHTQHYSYHFIISLYFLLHKRDTFICFHPYNNYTCLHCMSKTAESSKPFLLFICLLSKLIMLLAVGICFHYSSQQIEKRLIRFKLIRIIAISNDSNSKQTWTIDKNKLIDAPFLLNKICYLAPIICIQIQILNVKQKYTRKQMLLLLK